MQVVINGEQVEINDVQVNIVRDDVQIVGGRAFMSEDIVIQMLATEAENALAIGDVRSLVTLARVVKAFGQLIALKAQV